MIAGFPINVSIQGTGVKAVDTINLVSSYNSGDFTNVDEITLLESDVLNGGIDFIIDPLSFPSTKQIFDTTGNANFTLHNYHR